MASPSVDSTVKQPEGAGVQHSILRLDNPDSKLMLLAGSVAGVPMKILVDSGASSNFIDSQLVHDTLLTTTAQPVPVSIQLANGQVQDSHEILQQARLHIGTYKDTETFHVTSLPGYDAILGKEWLHRINPIPDWPHNTLRFRLNQHDHTPRPTRPSCH